MIGMNVIERSPCVGICRRQACILGQQSARTLQQAEKAQAKADKKRIRQLEQELRRKDKALAEAAALLILQKKLDAYWSNVDEDN